MTTDDDRGRASGPPPAPSKWPLSRDEMGGLVYSVRLARPERQPPDDGFVWPDTVPNPPPWEQVSADHWRLADRGITVDVIERQDGDCLVTGLPGKPQPLQITGLKLARLVGEQTIYSELGEAVEKTLPRELRDRPKKR